MKMSIEIDNLTDAQVLAIEDMLAQWQYLGGIGGSRWVAFFADGDGNFHPKIQVDGRNPQKYPWRKSRWKLFVIKPSGASDEGCFIDFDTIAWELRAKKEKL